MAQWPGSSCSRHPPGGRARAARAREHSAPRTLAVLPFANLSANVEDGFFADGLTEELLNLLAGIEGLKVAGRTSSFYFKGRNEDLREIGRKLGVSHILEGSVRRSGQKVRITAQLVSADDPTFVGAQAGKALALTLLWGNHTESDGRTVLADADKAARRALELDPGSSEAYVAAGGRPGLARDGQGAQQGGR